MLTPSRTIHHARVVAGALFAALALLAAGGAAPASAAVDCGITANMRTHSASNDLALALPAPYYVNGTRPIMWSYWGGDNQRWCKVLVMDKKYVYMNVLSGKCLTAAGPAQNGTPVDQQTCTPLFYNQLWTIEDVRPGRIALKSVGTGGCLDIIAKNQKPGAKLQIWGCSYASNQLWWTTLVH